MKLNEIVGSDENKILDRLKQAAASNESNLDSEFIKLALSDIKSKLKAGWTPDEIFNLMKNIEDINPSLDETTALKRMKKIRDDVEARLKNE